MIIQQMNSNYYVYVPDRINMLNAVLAHFGLISSNGGVFNFVQIQQTGNHFPKGGNVTLPATVVLAKDKVIFVLNDSYSFPVHRSNTNSLVSGLNHFGADVDVGFGDIDLKGPFVVRDSHHFNANGKKIITGNYLGDNNKKADEFTQRMRTDGGRMLLPLSRKYYDLAHLMGGNRNKLTGYVNLNMYLKMIKQPSMIVNDIDNSNYVLNIPDEQVHSTMKIVGVDKNKLLLSFISPAKLLSASSQILHPTPYLIFTLKPFAIQNQKLPFFITSIKNVKMFVSVIILEGDALLKSLSGGVNLLK